MRMHVQLERKYSTTRVKVTKVVLKNKSHRVS